MIAVEATVEKSGKVRLKTPVHLVQTCRAVVTIFEEPEVSENTLLSQQALSKDWDRSEEDAAWSHLQ